MTVITKTLCSFKLPKDIDLLTKFEQENKTSEWSKSSWFNMVTYEHVSEILISGDGLMYDDGK